MSRTGREIKEVAPYLNPAGVPRCKVTFLDGTVEPLTGVSRIELVAAARHTFPEHPGNVWTRFTSDDLRDMIWSLAAEPGAAREKVAAKVAEKGHPAQSKSPGVGRGTAEPDTYIPAPVTDLDPAEQAILEALRSRKGNVDLEQVREIVREEIALAEPQVTRIEIKVGDFTSTLPASHHEVLPYVTRLAAIRENILLVGPAGTGKSTIAQQVAEALGVPFGAISFGPTTPTSKLFGFQNAAGEFVGTEAHRVFSQGGVFLLDELDNGHPGLVAEMNQLLANGYAAFSCGMVKKHPDCIIIATGNTYGLGPDRLFIGRNQLDAATLDRFWSVDVPVDEKLETALAHAYLGASPEADEAIRTWVAYVRKVRGRVEEQNLPVIVSPRATISGCKALAAGFTFDECVKGRLFKGLKSDLVNKIN